MTREKQKISEELFESKNTLTNLKYVLNLISSRNISISELETIFNISGFDNDGDSKDRNGSIFKVGGEYVNKKDIGERIVLSDEQKELLEELSGFIQNENVSNELKQNLKNFVKNGDASTLNRMEAIMSMNQAGSVKEKIDSWVKRFSSERSRLELENAFFVKIEQKAPLKELLDLLAAYEQKDDKDRDFVAKLQGLAISENRIDVVTDSFSGFDGKNYTQSLKKLAPLGVSPVLQDRDAARVASKAFYELELASYKDNVVKNINTSVIPAQLRELLSSLIERPPIDSLDYIKTFAETRALVEKQLVELSRISRLDRANTIREKFKSEDPEEILEEIRNFPNETEEDIAAKQELVALYRTYTASERTEFFDKQFGKEILDQIQKELKEEFISPELGKNKEAFNYIRTNFVSTIFPLIESLRSDPTTEKSIEQFFGTKDGKRGRSLYEIRLKKLEEQRPLTDTERAYLESVELLSVFNPYLVAAANVEQGVTSEFLRHHFETLSNKTIENLKDGDYIPLVQIGSGPNGLAAIGEIVRNNPKLAAQMLVVDSGEQPGGPFAIPKGSAWRLNSANSRGSNGPALPEDPSRGDVQELKTVRAYGSPLRWYPGERKEKDKSVREGSINVTVDYLPTPDHISQASRYSTNEELQIILALQSAMLVNKMVLNTRVISEVPNPDPNAKGNKLVTLEIEQEGKETRTVTIATDALFVPAGLGEKTYGFDLKGKNAERVIELTKDKKGFPKISTTLEAFTALTSRTGPKESLGETLVIYGSGNSTDTLLELIGNTFSSGNPRLKDVKKIYVVAEGELSKRPRYLNIEDLQPRNGRPNLIEFVKARVGDITFDSLSDTVDVMDRRLKLVGRNGDFIVDETGKQIVADSVIAATGFRPGLDDIFKSYLDQGQSFKQKTGDQSPTEPVRLPTNPDVTVAETLKKDPTILFLGTASNADFNEEKLLQLPVDARAALLRNDVENAVAIGFRAPDTQAAVNLWLNTKDINLEDIPKVERQKVPLAGPFLEGGIVYLPISVDRSELEIPDNISNENLILSPLFSYSVGNEIEVQDKNGKGFNGHLDFELDYDPNSWEIQLVFKGGSSDRISNQIIDSVMKACADKDFQRYAINALQKKRRNRMIDIVLTFSSGKLNPQETFVQN